MRRATGCPTAEGWCKEVKDDTERIRWLKLSVERMLAQEKEWQQEVKKNIKAVEEALDEADRKLG